MRTPPPLASVALIVSAALLAANAAQAMDSIRFDQMTNQDRQAFLDSLSRGAETVLNQEARSADAAKVHQPFNDIIPGDALPIGEAELEGNLADQRVSDAEQHNIKNPDAPRLQVESALTLTLIEHDIQITPDFVKALMQQSGTFQSHSPAQSK
ncbi:MAG TPA: hypothetical protein VIY68_05395 [Steroidobacteraceae bacterium]